MKVNETDCVRWSEDFLGQALEIYRSPGRHYHNYEHISECLDHHFSVADAYRNRWAAYFALLFHDWVYDATRSDNEERSGATATVMLGERGAPKAFTDEVWRLIMATKHDREPDADDTDARLVIDIDLAILGASQDRYDRYEADVRKEYAHVSDDAFRAGRAAVLRRFLARPTIYLTKFFRDTYEAAARANLNRSLARLESAS